MQLLTAHFHFFINLIRLYVPDRLSVRAGQTTGLNGFVRWCLLCGKRGHTCCLAFSMADGSFHVEAAQITDQGKDGVHGQ
ncbi:MAG TPA: hypothetical protein DEB47_25145, partial [Citreicella sp.]|nr:hypothetical protein [Citreicella sp.]